MSRRTTRWPLGAPCWASVASPDQERARAFYRAVLGWGFRDAGVRAHDHVVCEVDGDVVAGIGAVPDAGAPAWTLYFATDDLGATLAEVVNGGGTVVAPAHEILHGGAHAATVRDVGGAQFGLLQAATFIGSGLVNEVGALVWEDGSQPDPEAAQVFYGRLFDYRYVPLPEAGDAYVMFTAADDDLPYGGLGGLASGTTAGWEIYFGVSDVDAAAAAASEHGGTVIGPPLDTPWGRLARFGDAGGAPFGVMAVDVATMPDRSG